MIDHLRDRGLGVDPVCRVLDLSPSTCFPRKKRPKSARRLRDEQLMPLIEQVHADSGGTWRPPERPRPSAQGPRGGPLHRRAADGRARHRGVIRGRRRRTTIPEPSAPRPPDLGRP